MHDKHESGVEDSKIVRLTIHPPSAQRRTTEWRRRKCWIRHHEVAAQARGLDARAARLGRPERLAASLAPALWPANASRSQGRPQHKRLPAVAPRSHNPPASTLKFRAIHHHPPPALLAPADDLAFFLHSNFSAHRTDDGLILRNRRFAQIFRRRDLIPPHCSASTL